jgi:hypothetical protein
MLTAGLGFEGNPNPVRIGDVYLDRVYVMIGNDIEPVDIGVRYEPEWLVIPSQITPLYRELADGVAQAARSGRHPYFNGPRARLLEITEDDTAQLPSGYEQRGLVLHLGPVSWEEFSVLNSLIDDKTVFPNGTTIRKLFADEQQLYANTTNLRWCRLSNILTINMEPITSDGYGIIQDRNPRGVSTGKGQFANGVAENMDRYLDEAARGNLDHNLNELVAAAEVPVDHRYAPRGVPSPLLTAQRGVREELGRELYERLRGTPDRYKFLNVIMDLGYFNPHLIGVVELGMTRDQVAKSIQESRGKDHSEARAIRFLPLDRTNPETMQFISAQERWSPPGLAAFITGMKYWEAHRKRLMAAQS